VELEEQTSLIRTCPATGDPTKRIKNRINDGNTDGSFFKNRILYWNEDGNRILHWNGNRNLYGKVCPVRFR
jgi:hypothetical protein